MIASPSSNDPSYASSSPTDFGIARASVASDTARIDASTSLTFAAPLRDPRAQLSRDSVSCLGTVAPPALGTT